MNFARPKPSWVTAVWANHLAGPKTWVELSRAGDAGREGPTCQSDSSAIVLVVRSVPSRVVAFPFRTPPHLRPHPRAAFPQAPRRRRRPCSTGPPLGNPVATPWAPGNHRSTSLGPPRLPIPPPPASTLQLQHHSSRRGALRLGGVRPFLLVASYQESCMLRLYLQLESGEPGRMLCFPFRSPSAWDSEATAAGAD